VERSAWTDERLDDMLARNESQFDRILIEMAALREEVRTEMRAMRSEIGAELRAVRRDMFYGFVAMFTAMIAVFGVLLAQAP